MDATLTDALWSTYFQLPNSDETSAARWIDLRIWKSSTPANAISAAIDNNGTSADGGNRASKTRSPVRITSVTTDAINGTAAVTPTSKHSTSSAQAAGRMVAATPLQSKSPHPTPTSP